MMKKILFGTLFLSIVVIVACNNNDKQTSDKKKGSQVEIQADSTNATFENLISFKVNKELIVSPIFNILRFDFGTGKSTSLNLTITNSREQHKTLTFNINGDTPGHYPLGSVLKTTKTKNGAYGNYSPDYAKNPPDQFNFVSGDFVITSIDTTAGVINATFYGTAKTIKGDSVVITDGNVINGKLNPGITKFK